MPALPADAGQAAAVKGNGGGEQVSGTSLARSLQVREIACTPQPDQLRVDPDRVLAKTARRRDPDPEFKVGQTE
jgi:hypothetical protein